MPNKCPLNSNCGNWNNGCLNEDYCRTVGGDGFRHSDKEHEVLCSQLTATKAKLTKAVKALEKAKVFEMIVRGMYPEYMSVVDGAVEVSLKALDKQS